ncbi:unnamed protein product [Calicophoron daubneyi]
MIIEWKKFPTTILVVHKFCDGKVIESLKEFVLFILQKWQVTVLLEKESMDELKKDSQFFSSIARYFVDEDEPIHESNQHAADNPSETGSCPPARTGGVSQTSFIRVFRDAVVNSVELIVCLGGDGTLLHIASMFQRVSPPVIAFRLGSLGFLTPFPFSSFPSHMQRAMEGSPNCLLRTRLCCQIVRRGTNVCTLPNSSSINSASRCGSPDTEYHFLNELVVDRGLSPSPCDLMVKVNGRTVTHFEGDGLIVSTATGSTAYSMATGASMLHPWVPAFLLTPINSFALSSRAIVLPLNLHIEISIASRARCPIAHFSFDGRSRASNLIQKGDSIIVTVSRYPIPCLCSEDQAADWFCSLNNLLNWNFRYRKGSGNVPSDNPDVPETDAPSNSCLSP